MPKVNYRIFFALIFASLALFLGDRNNFFYWPRYGIQTVINPVEYGLYSSKIWALESISFLGFWRSGEQRIKNLEQKNWELTSKLVLMKSVMTENEALRTQLGATQVVAKRKMLSAPVLGISQTMEIGVGQNDGVRVGMTVTFAGNLVGRVERITPHSAFVTTPADGNSKIPVAIGSVHAVAVGSYGSQILLQKVGQTDQVKKDDLVVTSGEGDSYSPGLILGKISKITGRETDLFRQAEVLPLLDLEHLTTVFVITDQ
jgi:rod shape-determining protein MreC